MARMTDFTRNKSVRLIGMFVTIGFVFRYLLLPFRFAAAFDEVNYLKLGVSAYLGDLSNVLHTYWSPLMPTLISLSCWIFPDYEISGRMISVISGALLAIPVYLLAKHVYDQTVGYVAAAFVTFFPPLAFQATLIYTESIYMLLAAFAVYSGIRMLESSEPKYGLLAGALTGLLFLLHPMGVGFLIVLAAWVVVAMVVKLHQLTVSRALLLLVPLIVGYAVVASPYLIYLKSETGAWTLSAKGAANQQFEAYEGEDEESDPFRTLDAENQMVLFDQIYHQGTFLHQTQKVAKPSQLRLGAFLSKYIRNAYTMLKSAIPALLTTLPMMLFGIGLLGTGWTKGQGRKIIYLLSFVGFYWFMVIPAFHIIERYLTPLWPICALFVAKGLVHVFHLVSEHEATRGVANRLSLPVSRFAFSAMTAALLGFSFLPEMAKIVSTDPYSTDYWTPPIEQKVAGLWLKEQAQEPVVLMCRYQTADIYAGNYNIRESITIPDNELERVIAYARNRRAGYILLSERYKDDNPKIAHLYDITDAPTGLRQIYAQRDATGYMTKIFEVLDVQGTN